MRALVAVLSVVVVIAANLLFWWWPNRPTAPPEGMPTVIQSVSFAPFRAGQSPLSKKYPSRAEIEADLKLLKGKVRSIRTYTSLEGMEVVPQLASKYDLKVWQGVWLGYDRKQNLEGVDALIEQARANPESIERVIVGNEVLLRRDMRVDQLIDYIRMVKRAVKQPVTYADVWEFWLRNPELAAEVDFITVHFLPYWEDEPIGLDRRDPDGQLRIEKHIVDVYRKVQAAFPGKKIVIGETGWPSTGRMRGDAKPGLIEQVKFLAIFNRLAEKHGFDYNIVEAFDQGWKSRHEGTVGAAWGLFTEDRVEKFRAGKPLSAEPDWRLLFVVSSLAAALITAGFASLRRRIKPKNILIFAVFAQAVCTVWVQATWITFSHAFYWERVVGLFFYATLLGLFAYAFLRGVADSLTRRMADPSLYGARVSEAWSAWWSLPRGAALGRPDLMAQILFLALTGLCIFHLFVLSIDWMIGLWEWRVSLFGYEIKRRWVIAIDGRYRDFPVWDFVLPTIVLLIWKLITVVRTGDVPRTQRLSKALSFGRLLGFDGTKGYVRLAPVYSRVRPVLPELLLALALIFGAVALVVTEGMVRLHDVPGGWPSRERGAWFFHAPFWNSQANWFAALAVLMAVPYIATVLVSMRAPLAEPPPESYTSKW